MSSTNLDLSHRNQGDILSYFTKDDTIETFATNLNTYTDIVFCTSFSNLKSGNINVPYFSSSPQLVVTQSIRLFLVSYINGRTLMGDQKNAKIWEANLKRCKWTISFNDISIVIYDGCVSCIKNNDNVVLNFELSEILEWALMSTFAGCSISLVSVPMNPSQKLVDLLMSRDFIRGIFIIPRQNDMKILSELCGISSLENISLVRNTPISKEIISLSTQLILVDKPASNSLVKIGIPVHINSKDDKVLIWKKFKQLKELSYYVNTDLEAADINQSFSALYKTNIQTNRKN